MNKILVQLPANRDFAGTLEIQNAAGKRIAGPFHVCGRVDDETARKNKNPGRDPMLPFGDMPFGEYQILKIIPTGEGTPYAVEEFGSAGMVLLRPKSGDAALADANGRFGFFIHGGARSKKRLLRPTLDGSLRLSDYDQRRFIQALRKMGEGNSFCLVVCTARAGAKLAVAAHERPRGNVPATLLLASSVAATTITGAIRQVVVRSLFPNIGATIAAAGMAFVAEHHASAHTSDYSGGGAATGTTTTSGSETGSSSGSASDASSGATSEHSTSSGTDNSGGTGMENTTSSGTENTGGNNTGGSSTGNSTTTSGSDMGSPSTAPSDTSTTTETGNSSSSGASDTSGSDNNTPHLKATLPGVYLNDNNGNENNTPSGTPNLPSVNVNVPRPENNETEPSGSGGTAGSATSEPENPANNAEPANSSPAGTENQNQPAAATPADNAIIEHDNQNAANPATPTTTPSSSGAMEQLKSVEQSSQDATHAATDEEAHQKASEGFDTPSTVAPPVQLPNDNAVVNPNAASGGVAPASAEPASAPATPTTEPSSSGSPSDTLAPAAGATLLPLATSPSSEPGPGGMQPASAAGMAPGSPIIESSTPAPANPSYYQKAAGYTGPLTSPGPSPQPQGALGAKLAQYQGVVDAMYAADSSYATGKYPPGYSILQNFTLAKNGTDAVLYGKMGPDRKPSSIILAFRGTANENDWTYANIPNGTGYSVDGTTGRSQAYVSAVSIAKLVQKEFPDARMTITGHSLGGGEAALASVATGLPAITFNAAGVDPAKYGYSSTAATSQITNYHVVGETLTTAQQATPLPAALGTQISVAPVTLPTEDNAGNHSMSAVKPAMINYLSNQ